MNIFQRMVRSADGAGGGAPTPPPADPAAAAAAPPPAGPADAAAAAPSPYRPEGLNEQFFGDDDRGTIDKLRTAVDGYRRRDSDRGVPDDVEAYGKFEAVDDKLKPYYATLENDGMFKDLGAVAKEHGVSTKAFQALVGSYMNAADEMGILEPPVDAAAERQALLPENAASLPKAEQDRAIDRRMNDNLGWIDQMVARGLPEQSAKHMSMMLGDSAKGHIAIEFFRSQIGGEGRPRPVADSSGGERGNAQADLQRRAALRENTPGDAKFSRASYDQLQVDYQKAYPDN